MEYSIYGPGEHVSSDVLWAPRIPPIPLEDKPDTDDTHTIYRGPLPDKRGEQIYKPMI